jgi:serine/threonine protein kinase
VGSAFAQLNKNFGGSSDNLAGTTVVQQSGTSSSIGSIAKLHKTGTLRKNPSSFESVSTFGGGSKTSAYTSDSTHVGSHSSGTNLAGGFTTDGEDDERTRRAVELEEALAREEVRTSGDKTRSSESRSPSTRSSAGLGFRWETAFWKHYEMGVTLLPEHSEKKREQKNVLTGRFKGGGSVLAGSSDARDVVIKMRHKKRDFKSENEIAEWTKHMKVMFKLSNKEIQGEASHICKVLDLIEDDSYYYVVMESLGKRDLFSFFMDWRASNAPAWGTSGSAAGSQQRLKIARQVAKQLFSGLSEMHGAGVMHLDLKLENIVLEEKTGLSGSRKEASGKTTTISSVRASSTSANPSKVPNLKIIDFDTIEIYKPTKPKQKYVLGSDQYIAPETYSGSPTPDSDVWSVGVILYIFLTGGYAFHYGLFDDKPGENVVGNAKMEQIRRRLRVARIDWNGEVFNSAEGRMAKDFVGRCFARDPKNRLCFRT